MSVFFFQAEDGIRDGHVTGVQTCALPILLAGPRGRPYELDVAEQSRGRSHADTGQIALVRWSTSTSNEVSDGTLGPRAYEAAESKGGTVHRTASRQIVPPLTRVLRHLRGRGVHPLVLDLTPLVVSRFASCRRHISSGSSSRTARRPSRP